MIKHEDMAAVTLGVGVRFTMSVYDLGAMSDGTVAYLFEGDDRRFLHVVSVRLSHQERGESAIRFLADKGAELLYPERLTGIPMAVWE